MGKRPKQARQGQAKQPPAPGARPQPRPEPAPGPSPEPQASTSPAGAAESTAPRARPAASHAFRGIRPYVLAAIFRRNFVGYFTNPLGYVFTGIFIFLCSVAAFVQPEFFTNNLANLGTLNNLMPLLLMVFIPAITMGIWAEERRQGTDELLLTLPAMDVEVVLGKYLAALGIYTVALVFLAIGCLGVLTYLGRPDWGVLFATFLGYWLMGAALIAVGMVASMLTANLTVAFILGAIFCVLPIWLGQLLGRVWRPMEPLAIPSQFLPFGNGKITFDGLCYFLALAGGMLYLNMLLLGGRHWAGGPNAPARWFHAAVRTACLLIALGAAVVLLRNAGLYGDVTQEKLHTLSSEADNLIKRIPADKPVFIEAYFSPEVPREYVQARQDLLNTLKAFAAKGGSKVRLNLIETERYSDQARDAEKRYGITPRRVMSLDGSRQESQEIFLGVAFTSGLEEVVVPFFDRGLPVEYEVTRSISTVSRTGRKKVGILQTDARLMGGLDFRSFQPQEEWAIVTELKKQYDVSSVSADSEIPTDIDVLLVAQPSSLPQRGIDNLTAYIRNGGAALLCLDPLPLSDPAIAPGEPRQSPGGMFGGGQQPEPKGNLLPLLDLIGVEWPTTQIVWNTYNPHRQQLPDLPPEVVFIGRDSAGDEAFNADQAATKGLQEVVLLFPGLLRPKLGANGVKFSPLLRTDSRGGTLSYDQLMQRGFMGSSLNPNRPYFRSGDAYTLAARLQGEAAKDADKKEAEKDAAKAKKGINVIALADLDMISETFFNLRKKQVGALEVDFDNVTFALNCVDVLAGDDELVALRKKRPQHRTLTRLETQSKQYEKKRLAEEEDADKEARKQLDEAQARLDKRVAEVRDDKEMDPRAKEQMLANLEAVENRRLDVAKAQIEDEKRRKVKSAKDDADREVLRLQNQVRLLAVLACPLPILLLGLGVFVSRIGQENRGANPNRIA
ncbi:MAG: Gldg family protein [Isosphaeraceae bacterium]